MKKYCNDTYSGVTFRDFWKLDSCLFALYSFISCIISSSAFSIIWVNLNLLNFSCCRIAAAQTGKNLNFRTDLKKWGTAYSTGPCFDKTKIIVEPALPLLGLNVGKSEKFTSLESLVFQIPLESIKHTDVNQAFMLLQ